LNVFNVARQADAFVAEATEIIAVVRIGISLVEHIYDVFSHIFEDSGLSESDLLGKLSLKHNPCMSMKPSNTMNNVPTTTGSKRRELEGELLYEYRTISLALDRMAQSNEQVQATISNLQRNLPSVIR
jgi:hypothetical protein